MRRRVRTHFPPMHLCPNHFPVLWQEQPQSSTSSAAFRGTAETVLHGRRCHDWQALWGAAHLGQTQVSLRVEAIPSVHRVVMLSGNVCPLCCFFFHFVRIFLACCSSGKLSKGLESAWAVGNQSWQGLSRQKQHFSFY